MALPADVARKRQLIIDYEMAFARSLAARVIEKPVLSIWMILLPILLVHYFYRHQKFKAGTTEFAAQFLRPRLRALDIATDPELPMPSSPAPAAESLQERLLEAERIYITIVTEHFRRLLAGGGDNYPGLVQSAYGDVGKYDRYVRESSEAFAAVNDVVLDVHCPDNDFHDIVRQTEAAMREVHRREADHLFAG